MYIVQYLKGTYNTDTGCRLFRKLVELTRGITETQSGFVLRTGEGRAMYALRASSRQGFITIPTPRVQRGASLPFVSSILPVVSVTWRRRPILVSQVQDGLVYCSSNSSNEDALSDMTVRLAKKADIPAISQVTARAFCEQDENLVMLQAKFGQRFKLFTNTVTFLYQEFSARDVAAQLQKRVGGRLKTVHVVLVAEQKSTGKSSFGNNHFLLNSFSIVFKSTEQNKNMV